MREILAYIIDFGGKEWSEDQHPRDERGRFSNSDGGDATSVLDTLSPSQPLVTSDVELAATALERGFNVVLNQPRQVSTLLNELANRANEAEAAGNKAPKINLCNVSVPGTNLFCAGNMGISRIQMPQLSGKAVPNSMADAFPHLPDGTVNLSAQFVAHLQSQGVKVEETMIDAKFLRATQNELDGVKVARVMQSIQKNGFDPTQRVWVSKDDYLVDGHHRWAALVGIAYGQDKPVMVPSIQADIKITDVLAEARAWTSDMGIQQEGFKLLALKMLFR